MFEERERDDDDVDDDDGGTYDGRGKYIFAPAAEQNDDDGVYVRYTHKHASGVHTHTQASHLSV